ncbi:uncharacterized protein BXZ73DRAFT_79560 [Epithele typhae]|uniref:uncharacterized protein n=1 Tax=Epithele typhae TaxID=378194 RepID=UPI0020085E3D|nr:uncharacterized protein BXZ73DRAFT_79560 [Epithele typhae]KAH9923144.1 hypothetical protein BXZ73DRAFT_79560 [Epithele typhae]
MDTNHDRSHLSFPARLATPLLADPSSSLPATSGNRKRPAPDSGGDGGARPPHKLSRVSRDSTSGEYVHLGSVYSPLIPLQDVPFPFLDPMTHKPTPPRSVKSGPSSSLPSLRLPKKSEEDKPNLLYPPVDPPDGLSPDTTPKTEERSRPLRLSRRVTLESVEIPARVPKPSKRARDAASSGAKTAMQTSDVKRLRHWLFKPDNGSFIRYETPPAEGQPTEIPAKLQANIASLKGDHDDLTFEVYYAEAQGEVKWGLKCVSCGCSNIFYTMGLGLRHIKVHLAGKPHRDAMSTLASVQQQRKQEKAKKNRKLNSNREEDHRSPEHHVASTSRDSPANDSASQAGGRLSSPALSSQPQSAPPLPRRTARISAHHALAPATAPVSSPAQDEVERFLEEIGLPTSLAGTLKNVGIKDDGRIKALGKLADTYIDRLDASLADAGLDFADRLLIQSGLKARAGTEA